ncbi:intradiol ring-cleavage dioxygenase [Flammeovirgaceae bacterium KN852]|uniref:Intradiol ring-cleavage dioxygenase n=2 Tax=Marinigracilibium pacificum TaxID=2729599 RepID=A0A848J235_9BACT|nr:intradiol ring-cleavage dioxygenase [Marinigracilibium pacificum]
MACNAQEGSTDIEYQLIGRCEGCEAVLEFESPVNSVDTLPGFNNNGARIKVSGTVYMSDGITPAPEVILYLYQTNIEGIYKALPESKGWEKRHGYIRGWVKADSNRKYEFYTSKPGVYPSRTEPAHIHVIILEPNGNYYWVDSYYFQGDTLLTRDELEPKNPRGGTSGILKLKETDSGLLIGTRDFILGKNVSGY